MRLKDRLAEMAPILVICACVLVAAAILVAVAVNGPSVGRIVERQVELDDGRTVACLVNTIDGDIDCDWGGAK